MGPVRPAGRVAGIQAYRVPAHPAPLDLDLRGNEGAVPDEALFEALRGAELLRRYPDAGPLERRLARRLGVDADRVVVTAGGDDALDRICRAVLEPGRRAVLPVPGFEMTTRYARLAGAEVVPVPWPGAAFPRQAVCDAIDADTGLVALTSPNNPTGAVASAEDLDALARACRRVGALLLVDLAYTEFAELDLCPQALALDNTVVVRTVSKAWGLAGLRVGYAVSSPEIAGWLRAAGAPFSVAAPSLALAHAALDQGDGPMEAFVRTVRQGRAELGRALQAAGCTVVPSQANFVFARSPRAAWLADGLAGLGIGVRAFPGSPDLADALRVACPPDAAATARVCAGLAAVATPQAVLFDMDGVLADVSGSYRAAIVQTAAAFGVQVDGADIAATKARGNANNDWVLTRELLAARGIDLPPTTVTEAFEARYQGTKDAPGLWTTETLCVTPAWLAALAGKVRLGVVTGRPRRDARRFLDHFGIAALFQVVVTMEDAPSKPDPAPVLRALEALGIRDAWLVGDTPDDVRAARAAGVVPLGICAPGDTDPGPLLAAGAARILSVLTELEELLP